MWNTAVEIPAILLILGLFFFFLRELTPGLQGSTFADQSKKITNVRLIPARKPEKSPHVVDDQEASPLNISSCLWIHYFERGRSGNRLIQIRQVNNVLSRCSGVAISTNGMRSDDQGVALPTLLFGVDKMSVTINPDVILETAAKQCREVTYEWLKQDELAEGCFFSSVYDVKYPTMQNINNNKPPLLASVYADKAAWKQEVGMDTMVMYFRGGDILLPNSHPGYSQAPCSLFLEAWRIADVDKALLVHDPSPPINPCVNEVRNFIPASKVQNLTSQTVGAHLTLLGRAKYLVISGLGSFAKSAMQLFPYRRRVYFTYFCEGSPLLTTDGMHVCMEGETSGLRPWKYTEAVKKEMLTLQGRMQMGSLTPSDLVQYLQEANENLTTRLTASSLRG